MLDQQDAHHQQLIDQPHANGADDHGQQAIAAEPMAGAEPILRGHEEHEEACQNDIRRGENVQGLQDLLNDQILKVAGVVQEFAEGTQLRPALFRNNKDKGQHRGHDGDNDGNDAHSAQIYDCTHKIILAFSLYSDGMPSGLFLIV